MKKFLAIVGLLSVIAAAPASAQSYTHDFGTGNVIDVPALEQGNGGSNGMSAFAQAPAPERTVGRNTRIDSDSPAATGGGSEGYNWKVNHAY
jgi:opacity protein-like surface antigen